MLTRRNMVAGAIGLGFLPTHSVLLPANATVAALATTGLAYVWDHIGQFEAAAKLTINLVTLLWPVKTAEAAPSIAAQIGLAGTVSSGLASQPAFLEGIAAVRTVVREELERAAVNSLISNIQSISDTAKDFVISASPSESRSDALYNLVLNLTPKVYDLGKFPSFVIFPAYATAASLHTLLAQDVVAVGRAPKTALQRAAQRHRDNVSRWLSPDVSENPVAQMAALKNNVDELTKELEGLAEFPISRNVFKVSLPVVVKEGDKTVTKSVIKTRVAEVYFVYRGYNAKSGPVLNRNVKQIHVFEPNETVPYEFNFSRTIGSYINIAPTNIISKIPQMGGDSSDYISENREIISMDPVELPKAVRDVEERKVAGIIQYYKDVFDKRQHLVNDYEANKRMHESILSVRNNYDTLAT